MAQHIPTRLLSQKAFRKIEEGVHSAFNRSRGLMKTSMRYQYHGVQEGMEVYSYARSVPSSMVHGGIATIEIHWNPVLKKIEEIYLVA